MFNEEEEKSLLPAQQQSNWVTQQEDEDQEGQEGEEEGLLGDNEQLCWISRHKILTAVVVFTALTCIASPSSLSFPQGDHSWQEQGLVKYRTKPKPNHSSVEI